MMKALATAILSMATTFGVAAQHSAGDGAGWYLRGALFTKSTTPWGGAESDLGPQFKWDDNTTMSVTFPVGLPTDGKSASEREFAITTSTSTSMGWPWNETIVLGSASKNNGTYVNGLAGNTEYNIYFGGSGNGVLPENFIISKITITLPTNTSAVQNPGADADNNPGAGTIVISGYSEAGVPTTGKSAFGLQVWAMSQTSSTTAAWDVSGGLMWPAIQQNDPTFFDLYHEGTAGGAEWIMFRTVDSGSIRYVGDKGDGHGNYNTPLTGYDPDTQVLQYHSGSHVYIIDYKHDMTRSNYTDDNTLPSDISKRGVYVKVPNATAKDDNAGNTSYGYVPRILRSGARFGLYHSTATAEHLKYLKYGRGVRLNEIPQEIGHGSFQRWNGVDLGAEPDITIDGLKGNGAEFHHIKIADGNPYGYMDLPSGAAIGPTFYDKLGDNRLVSEYNMFVDRIILEVLNEDTDNEKVYIRFEGRYDLEAIQATEVTYSFSSKGMADNTNRVGTEPNIYMGNTIRYFDRAFTRFYACYNPQYHDKDYKDNIADAPNFMKDIETFGLRDYTRGYEVESEYSVLDANGNVVDYIGYENQYGGNIATDNGIDLGLKMKSYPAKFSISYNYGTTTGANGDIVPHFYATEINGIACDGYSGRELMFSANTPSEIRDPDKADDTKYGNATQAIVQGRRMRLISAPTRNGEAGIPSKVKIVNTYRFDVTDTDGRHYQEPNNVPTYTVTYDLPAAQDLGATPALTIDNGAGKGGYDGKAEKPYFMATASLKGATYAFGKVWEPQTGATNAVYPVTRWELSAWESDNADATDDSKGFDTTDGIGKEAYVGAADYNTYSHLDSDNKFGNEEIGFVALFDPQGSWAESTANRNIKYRARMVYTIGNVRGKSDEKELKDRTPVVISERALEQYYRKDILTGKTDGLAPNNAYAILYKNGTEEKSRDVSDNEVTVSAFTLTPRQDIAKDGNIPDLDVSLYEWKKDAIALATFANRDQVMTGIEDVASDEATAAEAEYYNLQGVRVAEPTPGTVCIVRRGHTVTKELVR